MCKINCIISKLIGLSLYCIVIVLIEPLVLIHMNVLDLSGVSGWLVIYFSLSAYISLFI